MYQTRILIRPVYECGLTANCEPVVTLHATQSPHNLQAGNPVESSLGRVVGWGEETYNEHASLELHAENYDWTLDFDIIYLFMCSYLNSICKWSVDTWRVAVFKQSETIKKLNNNKHKAAQEKSGPTEHQICAATIFLVKDSLFLFWRKVFSC